VAFGFRALARQLLNIVPVLADREAGVAYAGTRDYEAAVRYCEAKRLRSCSRLQLLLRSDRTEALREPRPGPRLEPLYPRAV
jgi:hypothetical protein